MHVGTAQNYTFLDWHSVVIRIAGQGVLVRLMTQMSLGNVDQGVNGRTLVIVLDLRQSTKRHMVRN